VSEQKSADEAIDRMLALGDRELAWIGRGEGDLKGLTELAKLLDADPQGMVRETVALARAFLEGHPLTVEKAHGGQGQFMRLRCTGGEASCGFHGPPRRSLASISFDRARHDRETLLELRAMAVEGDPVRDAVPDQELDARVASDRARGLAGETPITLTMLDAAEAELLRREAQELDDASRDYDADERTPVEGIDRRADETGI
jgi:hypothetical protein